MQGVLGRYLVFPVLIVRDKLYLIHRSQGYIRHRNAGYSKSDQYSPHMNGHYNQVTCNHGNSSVSLQCFLILFPSITTTTYAAAAAAAKSLQSCPTLCDPRDGSPPGSPVPGILQARILEWLAISFSNAWKWKVKVKLLRLSTWKLHSRVRLLATPWTAVYQAPPSMGFSRQDWSGVPLPSPTTTYDNSQTLTPKHIFFVCVDLV